MSYKNLIDNALLKAFNLSKDLASFGVFVKKTTPSFNFANATAEFLASNTITTKCVDISTKKTSTNSNTINKTIIVKTKDVGDLNLYSTVSIENKTWSISQVQKNDGFISMIDIYREV